MSHSSDLQVSPQPSRDPSEVSASDVTMLDDWADFYDALPADLVFECSVELEHDSCSVAVYRDRIIVEEPGEDVPTVLELQEITSWHVGKDGDHAVIDLAAAKPRCTRLPSVYAGAIRVALHEVLGESTQL